MGRAGQEVGEPSIRRSTLLLRRTAIAAAAVVAAGAGWWLIRGPAVVRGAVATPPEIDIDPPAMRARRDAAMALAMAPDDPWTFAESLAASAPSSAPAAARERCGIEDGPQFSTPSADEPVVQTRAPSMRRLNAEARIDAVLRASADPLDRAVADLVNIGDMRSESGVEEAVARLTATTTDPRAYALGYGLCESIRASAASCAAITAGRWAELDAGNGAPWLYLLAQARNAGDTNAVADALAHLASSSRFDSYYSAAAGAVARRAPKDGADLAAYADVVVKAVGAASGLLPASGYVALIQVCRNHAGGDEQLEQACRATGDGMFEHSDNLMSQSISGALLFQMTGDPTRRDMIRAERAVFAAHWSPATGLSPCQDLRDMLKQQRRAAEIGEVAALRERAREFVTP